MATKKQTTFQNGDEVLSHFIPGYERDHLVPYDLIGESGLSTKSGAVLGRKIAREFQGQGPDAQQIAAGDV